MINPMDMISSMQEMMDKHGFKYPFAIKYAQGAEPHQVNVELLPIWPKDCTDEHVWGDNDNNSSK